MHRQLYRAFTNGYLTKTATSLSAAVAFCGHGGQSIHSP